MEDRVSPRREVFFRTIILIGLGLFLYSRLLSGAITFYINRRFTWLTWGAALALLIMGIVQGQRLLAMRSRAARPVQPRQARDSASSGHGLPVWSYLALLIPLLLGVVIPPQPLGASVAGNRGLTSAAGIAQGEAISSVDNVPARRDILGWLRAFGPEPAPEAFAGQTVDVVGFVYRDEEMPADQFMVARFLIVCCVADAIPVGLPVHYAEAAHLELDTWVRVRGTFVAGEVWGEWLPVIAAEEVAVVSQPAQPYLYP
jgi:uncharacterized repeat protein (TIGR03943 family)